MGFINAAQILESDDLPKERVEVPEWGEGAYVFVRSLTAEERDNWESSLIVGEGDQRKFDQSNVRARLVVRCLCNEKGDRLFADEQAGMLGKKSAKVVARLFDAAQRMNGIGVKEEVDLGKS